MGKTQKIILKHSSIQGKTPKELEYGEPAVNYCAGNEFISIKNTNNEIVKFEAQPKVDLSQYAMKTELSNFLKAGDLGQYVKKEEVPFDMLKDNLINSVKGSNSFAVGNNNKIFSDYSFTSGNNNIIYGANSFAAGNNNNLYSKNSHILGANNYIDNFASDSFFIGQNNTSNYSNCYVFGINNELNQENSTVIGEGNKTMAKGSIAIGKNLQTCNQEEIVLGRNNDAKFKLIFSVGSGKSKYRRRNAFNIDVESKSYFLDTDNNEKMFCLQDKIPKDTVQLTFTLEDGSSQTLNVCTR